MAVSFTVGVKPHLAVLRFDYNDVPPFVLAHNGVGARVPVAGKIALERMLYRAWYWTQLATACHAAVLPMGMRIC